MTSEDQLASAIDKCIIDDAISQEAAAKREKIKTPFAQIIVNNNPEKTYYNIMWWQDEEMHIGFGSANLSLVRKWLSEEFEADYPPADVAPVVQRGKWIGWHGDKMVGDGEYRHYHYNTCSECYKGSAVKSNFCPNCGARMDGHDDRRI